MDWNRLAGMAARMLLRRMMNFGMRQGGSLSARGGKPAAAMTPAEREAAATARDLAKRAQKVARLTRRF